MDSTTERRTVQVTIGGETRDVAISRYSPSHNWLPDIDEDVSRRSPVAYRYPTGSKIHFTHCYILFQDHRGDWKIQVAGRNGRGKYCRLVCWATAEVQRVGTCSW